MMKPLHVLGICGSLRQQSTNFGLLRYAKNNVPSGLEIELADLQDVPFYNADLKEEFLLLCRNSMRVLRERMHYSLLVLNITTHWHLHSKMHSIGPLVHQKIICSQANR